MSAPWLYFGCSTGAGSGHRLEDPAGFTPRWATDLRNFDGQLAPRGSSKPYLASLTRLGGWTYSALSWWDYSVDTRPGSNVIVFAPSIDCSADTIMAGFQKFFPREARRFVGEKSILILGRE